MNLVREDNPFRTFSPSNWTIEMKTAFGVIGANYGDEAKGSNVDRIVHGLGGKVVVVVRSNGGAQAGHTVVTPDGRRHVFHHIGSGAYAGAATHLSRFFVHHPMSFMAERDELAAEGACVKVTADPHGYVTTPWDMMVNQVLEVSRGRDRHGSCGYGLGETMGRNEETMYGLNFGDLSWSGLRRKLESIRDIWLRDRLLVLGVTPDEEMTRVIASPAVMEHFLADCAEFVGAVRPMDDAELGKARHVVFEGAQGLLLDQRGKDFPHVTRSNTGIQNMAAIAREAGIGRIEATYATRAYLTRHGAGPMPDERDISQWFDVVDATNVPNAWQSAIRYGLLNVDLLAASIRNDVVKAPGMDVVVSLAVSCLDQIVTGRVPCVVSGASVFVDAAELPGMLAKRVGAWSVVPIYSAGRALLSMAA